MSGWFHCEWCVQVPRGFMSLKYPSYTFITRRSVRLSHISSDVILQCVSETLGNQMNSTNSIFRDSISASFVFHNQRWYRLLNLHDKVQLCVYKHVCFAKHKQNSRKKKNIPAKRFHKVCSSGTSGAADKHLWEALPSSVILLLHLLFPFSTERESPGVCCNCTCANNANHRCVIILPPW